MDRVTVECPVADIDIEKMREICHHHKCIVGYQNADKVYFNITGKPQDIFWLAMNIPHRLGFTKAPYEKTQT